MTRKTAQNRLNTHRHDNTAVPLVLDAFDQAGTQRILELEDHLLALHGCDGVQDIARVEPDRELLALVVDLEGLLGLPQVLARGGQAECCQRRPRFERRPYGGRGCA